MKLVRVHAAPQLGLVLGVSSRFVARQSVPRRRRDGSRWCRASDIALWRRACEHSPAPLRALPARTPCERYLNLSSKPAGGSQLPPPPPPRRGRSSAIIACITVQSVPGTLEAQNQPIRDQLVEPQCKFGDPGMGRQRGEKQSGTRTKGGGGREGSGARGRARRTTERPDGPSTRRGWSVAWTA